MVQNTLGTDEPSATMPAGTPFGVDVGERLQHLHVAPVMAWEWRQHELALELALGGGGEIWEKEGDGNNRECTTKKRMCSPPPDLNS
jgi:hypothetical protein